MMGFEGAIESRFEPGQGWIASSQVLLAMTMTPRFRSRNASRCYGRLMRHCYAHRHLAPDLTAVRFFCGIFSAFAWQPPVPRHRLHHATAAKKPGSVSCHSSVRQRCRGFASCRPQAGKNSRTEVKCLNAGPNRSATRCWPQPTVYPRRTKSARLAAVTRSWTISASIATRFLSRLLRRVRWILQRRGAMGHKCFNRHAISLAALGFFRGFSASQDASASTGARFSPCAVGSW
jgi:hypothetical protein